MSEQIRSRKIDHKPPLAVLGGNAIFGLSFLFSKLALDLTVPSVLIAVRFTVAFALLSLIVFVGRNMKGANGAPLISFSLKGKPRKYILLLALFQPVIYFIAENYGIVYTSSSFAGVIIAVIPITGVMLDVLIMHTRVGLKQVLCAIGSVAGVAITTIGARDMTSSTLGIIFLLIAVLAGALFYVFSKKAGEHYNALERTWVMFGIGSAFYIPLALIQCAGSYDRLIVAALSQPTFWLSILYLSVLSSVVAFMLLNYGSSHVSVSQATLFANFTTVISIIAGVVILHESFTLQQIVGAAVILVSVYIAR